MAGSRESSRTTSEPPGSHELSAFRPCFKGKRQENSYESGGSDVVRELSREPDMFQIGLQGEVQMTFKMVIGNQWKRRGDCGRHDGNCNGN